MYHKSSLELSHPIGVVGGGEMSRAGFNEPPPNKPSGDFKPHDEPHITVLTIGEMDINLARTPQLNTISSTVDG